MIFGMKGAVNIYRKAHAVYKEFNYNEINQKHIK